MSKNPTTLKFTRTIEAPVAQVYFAFTNKSGWREWFSDGAEGDAIKLKHIFLAWKNDLSASVRFSELKENEQLKFVWHGSDDPRPTEVTVSLRDRDGQTDVEVEHRGLVTAQVERITKLWNDGLENLKSVLETGRDRRLYNKPMMGVMIADMVTPEIAEKKNLIVDHGMLLSSVLSGMGAETSGLTAGDLVVEISGIKIEDILSVEKALKPLTAGDVVEMVYYRDDEKQLAQVELSSRPSPEIPTTAQDFSDQVSNIYSSANAKFDEVFEDVTDEQAEYRPVLGEWNSKEVLAHLIASERDMYAWSGSVVQGNEAYLWTDQLPSRLKSIQVIFPIIPKLRQELVKTQQEGVIFLSELPGEFVARKSSFARMVNSFIIGTPLHYTEHIKQIHNNLVAAQGIG